MTTGSDVQTAINRLIRRRQRRQPKVITRPPVRGTSGEADFGEDEDTTPPVPAGLVYLPMADEAVHGWGAPFDVNPPMGTVQASWNIGNQVYRRADNPGSGWQVTHQGTALGSGGKWWMPPGSDKPVSWVAIAGWRDLSASEASVPAGYEPIFQQGDVLTWVWPGSKIMGVAHDGTYLYVAYMFDIQAYITRTPITLGAGVQAPAWETTGQIALPGPEGTSYETVHMAIKDDGSEALMNVVSVGRAAPGWDLPSDNLRYYEEWTLDLSAYPAYSAVKTGDASVDLSNSWDDTSGKTVQEQRDLVNSSTRGFAFSAPPMPNPRFESQFIKYSVADWSVNAFLISWYDRETQAVQRYTARMNVAYEQAVPAAIYYTEDETVALPPAPGYAWCEEPPGGGAGVCAVNTVPNNRLPRLGEWRHERRKLYARAELVLSVNGNAFDTLVLLDHQYDNNIDEGFYVDWATTGSLPCVNPTYGRPCGDDPAGMQRLTFTPPKIAGQDLRDYGLPYPGNTSTIDELAYDQRNPVLVGNYGDHGDLRGNLLQYAAEQVREILDDVDQLAPGEAHYYWRIFDIAADDTLLEQTRNDVRSISSPIDPPSDGKHFDTLAPPTLREWSEWIQDILGGLRGWRLYDRALHHQPVIRLPNGTAFVSFALYDNFPTMQPQSIVYAHEFTDADLRTLTGLDQVTATNERYSKLLEDGDSGAQIIVPGLQGVAGVI